MAFNKVITNFDALLNNVILDESDLSNSICIDTSNNRFGIKVADPKYELDISGNVQFGKINLLKKSDYDVNNIINDISYDFNHLVFSNGIHIKNDAIIDSSLTSLNLTCLSGNILDISSLNIKNKGNITAERLDVSYILLNNIDISGGDISCSNNMFLGNNFDCSGEINCSQKITGYEFISTKSLTGSDDRIKHNEVDISNGLKVIRLLKPQKYEKTRSIKSNNYNGILNEDFFIEAGLIAQDLLNINDLSFCVYNNNGILYNVDYNSIFVYGIQSIKELDSIVDNYINKDLKEFSNKLLEINSKINSLNDNLNLNNNKLIQLDNNIHNLQSNEGLANISKILANQNQLITNLTSKILNLENKIKQLENNN